MPYNLRRRYNLRKRGQAQQGRPPTRRKGQRKGRAAAEQHPKSTGKGEHRGGRGQDNRDTTPSPAAAPQDQEQPQRQSPSLNDEMHPWLKEMGYEKVAFIPDPEAGLKEGEEPPPLGTVEEDDPDVLNYGPWPETDLQVDPAIRDAATRSPFIAAWVRAWDRMHEPRA